MKWRLFIMKFTILTDNISNDNVNGEWGLCVYIEYNGKKILLDTGASDLFIKNAEIYDIHLENVDMAVLSHAHCDHAKGMEPFFLINQKAKFYLQATTKENCYSRKSIFPKYIGIPKGILNKYSDRIEFVSGDYKLCDGVYLISHKTPGLESIGKQEKMYIRKGITWHPDNFSHEQSLVFDTSKGLIIFNSCSHTGADTVINEINSTFPDKCVYALIGGFHLFNKSEIAIRDLAHKVKNTNVNYICTGHCTGNSAYHILREELGDIILQFYVGFSMEL